MIEFTLIEVFGNGRTEPHIPSETIILLIQDGKAAVGRFMQDSENQSSFYIDHPKNQNDLDIQATAIVKERKPEYLKSDRALILICPTEILLKTIF